MSNQFCFVTMMKTKNDDDDNNSNNDDHTVPCTRNTQDSKVQHTRAFVDVCQLHQLRRPSEFAGDIVREGDDQGPPSSACLSSLSSWWCPILVVNCTSLHLHRCLGWGLWSIWPLSLLSQTIWALLLLLQCFPTPRNVEGDQRGCVLKPLRSSS